MFLDFLKVLSILIFAFHFACSANLNIMNILSVVINFLKLQIGVGLPAVVFWSL